MSDKIRTGVIGVRGMGKAHGRIIEELPICDLVAACDANQAWLQEFATQFEVSETYTDYREMLAREDLDCVTVCTPHDLHPQMVRDALEAGKHVLCEKPLTIRYEDSEMLVKLAREKGLMLGCNYNQRLHPGIKKLKKAIDEGVMGEVYYVHARWLARRTGFWYSEDTGWRVSKARSGGGILIGRGSHLIDAVWHVLGKPKVNRLSAFSDNRVAGKEVEDVSVISLDFETGCHLHVDVSYVMHTPHISTNKLEYEVYGTEAGAVVDREQCVIGRTDLSNGEWTDLTEDPMFQDSELEGAGSVIEAFFLALAEGGKPEVTDEDAAFITRVVEAAYESAESGQTITF